MKLIDKFGTFFKKTFLILLKKIMKLWIFLAFFGTKFTYLVTQSNLVDLSPKKR